MVVLKHFIDQYRFLFLFILILDHLICKAVSPTEWVSTVNSLGLLLIIIYSIYVIGKHESYLWLAALIAGASAIGLELVYEFRPQPEILVVSPIIAAMFHAIMVYACLYFTMQDSKITMTTLFGSLCAYLFIGEFFASLYLSIYNYSHLAFKGLHLTNIAVDEDLIYFSFVTLTTLGYGDIAPVSALAKMLSWLEAYIGQAYLTILMALLVGRYLKQQE